MTRTLLALFAHPDDEAFGMAGTLARANAEGWRTVLVCATRGEVGEISDPALATPETLGAVREGELRCAAAAMGLHELLFLDWRDSGMAGTLDNADPRAFTNAPAAQLVAQLAGVIRRERPEIVVTFDPSGGYGHPDHIAIHQHTLAALDVAADLANDAPWDTPHVYYMVFPRSRFAELRAAYLANGGDPAEAQQFERDDLGYPDDQITANEDVTDYVDAKWRALRCHRTQFGENGFMSNVPEATLKQLMSREAFVQVKPPPAPGARRDSLLDAP